MKRYLRDENLTWAAIGLAAVMDSENKERWSFDELKERLLDDPEFIKDAIRILKKYGYIKEIEDNIYVFESE